LLIEDNKEDEFLLRRMLKENAWRGMEEVLLPAKILAVP